MTLVMTLLARDEIDIVDSWLAFHLNAGVDFVIATDNRSQDGTTEMLEEYARSGQVHLIREPGEDLRQDEWVTRMARLAADRLPGRLGDQLRCGRVLVAAGGVALRGARGGAAALRDGRRVPPRVLPETWRRALRRPDDGAFLRARADQRSGVAVQADPQDPPSRPS